MYKIFKFLFGWDYITWEDCLHKGVSRVRTLPNGEPYFLQYGSNSGFTYIKKSNEGSIKVYAWMTCDPSKYLND